MFRTRNILSQTPTPGLKRRIPVVRLVFFMGSLEEQMSVAKRIIINSDEKFVIEVRHNGVNVVELSCSIKTLQYNLISGKSNVDLSVYNAKSHQLTIYET